MNIVVALNFHKFHQIIEIKSPLVDYAKKREIWTHVYEEATGSNHIYDACNDSLWWNKKKRSTFQNYYSIILIIADLLHKWGDMDHWASKNDDETTNVCTYFSSNEKKSVLSWEIMKKKKTWIRNKRS